MEDTDVKSPKRRSSMDNIFIKRSSSHLIEIDLTNKTDHFVAWEFQTEEHDIVFGASFVTSSKKEVTVKPPVRLADADKIRQSGEFKPSEPGVLRLTWDNSYSTFRGKNLRYRVKTVHKDTIVRSIPMGSSVITPFGVGVIEGFRHSDQIYVIRLAFGQGYLNPSMVQLNTNIPPLTDNERAIVGVDLFFNNRVQESEDFFKPEIHSSQMFAMAHAAIGFLRALMTWEKSDIEEALNRAKQTRQLVASSCPQEGALTGIGRMLTRSKSPNMTIGQWEATLFTAECHLLTSILWLTQESYMQFIKAGWCVRSSWKLYERCFQQMQDDKSLVLDRSMSSGILFGVGAFNLYISIMPAIILKVVSALGFPSDRVKGLDLLFRSLQTDGTRSPLASLALLCLHAIVPSFFTAFLDYHIQESERILAICFNKYPEGALFLWNSGRLRRLKRDVDGAIHDFERAARAQPTWLQLQHLCSYDLGWCYFFKLQFEMALGYFERLEKENSWSKPFFCYTQAMCILNRGGKNNEEEARKMCQRAVEGITRKFGGKNLSFEQFVMRRGTDFARDNKIPILPALELVYLFNGFVQMSKECVSKAVEMVDAKIKAVPDMSTDQLSVCNLIKASALHQLGQSIEAESMLLKIDNMDIKDVKEETYTIPEARFNLATIYMHQARLLDSANTANGVPTTRGSISENQTRLVLLDKADAALKRLKAFKPDYNFKIRLHLRVHLAQIELKAMKEGKSPALVGQEREDDADDVKDDKANEKLLNSMTTETGDVDDVTV